MLSHLLNTKILLQQEITTKNAMGAPVETWEDYRYTFAGVKYAGGTTEFNELGDLAYTNTDFTIRYNPEVDYKFRVCYNNGNYKILHIEVIGKKEGLRLVTILFNDDGS